MSNKNNRPIKNNKVLRTLRIYKTNKLQLNIL